jgi:hypothetical protein
MSDVPRKGSRIRIFWGALVALALLYPLSMGPALNVATKIAEERDDHHIVRSVFRVYEPLLEAARATGLIPLLNWYVQWFAAYSFG